MRYILGDQAATRGPVVGKQDSIDEPFSMKLATAGDRGDELALGFDQPRHGLVNRLCREQIPGGDRAMLADAVRSIFHVGHGRPAGGWDGFDPSQRRRELPACRETPQDGSTVAPSKLPICWT